MAAISPSERPTLDVERHLAEQGCTLVVGFDEVGRGALAGPVMVGAAAIRADGIARRHVPEGVADSKLLTAHRREAMFDGLCAWCTAYAVGQATNAEIDEWGISYALGIASLRALNNIEIQLGIGEGRDTVDANTVDANTADTSAVDKHSAGRREGGSPAAGPRAASPCVGAILDGPYDYITKALGTFDAPLIPVPARVTTQIKADRHCASVATASVIAKVTRDRLMIDIAQGNPAYRPYHWAQNKGYGSAEHRAAIARYGATDLHRRSWHLV